MLSAGAVLGGGPFEKWYLDAGPCPEQVVYQLVGADSERLAGAAALLEGMNCLGVDINMGCAAPAIRRTGAGITWTKSVDGARAMIGRVRSAVKRKRLSVKLRCPLMPEDGPQRGDEGLFEYLARFCRGLQAEGVQLITLHPRLAGEQFKRRARWDYVERLRRELEIPVAGNGDIASGAELAARSREGRAMVGRAAVRRPWIFARARMLLAGGEESGASPAAGPGASSTGRPIDLEKTGLRFLELLAWHQPPEFHLSRARRFFNYFCDNLKWGTYVKNLLNREQDLAGIEAAWRAYFASHPEERLLRG
jgi:tRNA-dihydrouridine synthase